MVSSQRKIESPAPEMVKHLLLRITFAFIFLNASIVHGQSILGGNITWECLGGDQYNVALNVVPLNS